MDKDKYKVEIFYSEEDQGYIAVAPELKGCSAFGETKEQALQELDIAMALWIKVAIEDNEVLPEAKKYKMAS